MDWNNRAQRIRRLQEKESFRAVIMPLSFWGSALGWLGLIWEGIVVMDGGRIDLPILAPVAFFAFLPFPLLFYRWVRGHFNKHLHA